MIPISPDCHDLRLRETLTGHLFVSTMSQSQNQIIELKMTPPLIALWGKSQTNKQASKENQNSDVLLHEKNKVLNNMYFTLLFAYLRLIYLEFPLWLSGGCGFDPWPRSVG